jgi:hypothetical protein
MAGETKFGQLAAAYPLHFHRIVECVAKSDPRNHQMWRDEPADISPGWTLSDAFDWSETVEGTYYWLQLAKREGFMQ